MNDFGRSRRRGWTRAAYGTGPFNLATSMFIHAHAIEPVRNDPKIPIIGEQDPIHAEPHFANPYETRNHPYETVRTKNESVRNL